jgi:hypothetical protein
MHDDRAQPDDRKNVRKDMRAETMLDINVENQQKNLCCCLENSY